MGLKYKSFSTGTVFRAVDSPRTEMIKKNYNGRRLIKEAERADLDIYGDFQFKKTLVSTAYTKIIQCCKS